MSSPSDSATGTAEIDPRPPLMELLDLARSGVIVQGITGAVASRHARSMRDYGTNIVAGVVPGRGGQTADGTPVFDSVRQATEATGAGVSVVLLSGASASDGLLEAAEAGIKLAVCVTEGIPGAHALFALEYAATRGMTVVGPNTGGIAIPRELLLGFLPVQFATSGPVAVLSRSGTLSYETVLALTNAGIGQALWVGVGGDLVRGTTFSDVIPSLARTPKVKALVLIGEIGGSDEENAARTIERLDIPTVALVAGRHAPVGVSMGHAGALVEKGYGDWESKVSCLRNAGVRMAPSPAAVADELRALLPSLGSR